MQGAVPGSAVPGSAVPGNGGTAAASQVRAGACKFLETFLAEQGVRIHSLNLMIRILGRST